MKHLTIFLTLCTLILTSCSAPATPAPPTDTPKPAATQTPLPPTVTATALPTATATLIPTDTPTPMPTETPTTAPTLTPTEITTPLPAQNGQLSDLPAPLGGGGTILFTSDRNGTYDIFSLQAGETQVTQLSNLPGGEFFPEYAASGEFIIYFYVDNVSADPSLQLRWMNSDGSEDSLMLSGPIGGWPAISSDGNYLVFGSWSDDGCLDNSYDLVMVDFDANEMNPLLETINSEREPDWSPDGRTIAFAGTVCPSSFSQIFLVDADGSNVRPLIERANPEPMSEFTPAWSPDGSQIAFSYGNDQDTQIFVVNADGTGLRQITNAPGTWNESPFWSPDGTLLVFWSNRDGNKDLYVTTLDGSLVVNLTNSPGNDEDPVWYK